MWTEIGALPLRRIWEEAPANLPKNVKILPKPSVGRELLWSPALERGGGKRRQPLKLFLSLKPKFSGIYLGGLSWLWELPEPC